MILGRAPGFRVVEAKNEAAAPLARPQPIVQRRPDIADMEAAGRRGGDAGGDGHDLASLEGASRRQSPLPSGEARLRESGAAAYGEYSQEIDVGKFEHCAGEGCCLLSRG